MRSFLICEKLSSSIYIVNNECFVVDNTVTNVVDYITYIIEYYNHHNTT